jgi:fumarate hydratase, class II
VNLGQSSNDVIPTAMHIAALKAIQGKLLPALEKLHAELKRKAEEFDPVVKIGRTHLADATPIRLGQEFSGYTRQIELSIERISGGSRPVRDAALAKSACRTPNQALPSCLGR